MNVTWLEATGYQTRDSGSTDRTRARPGKELPLADVIRDRLESHEPHGSGDTRGQELRERVVLWSEGLIKTHVEVQSPLGGIQGQDRWDRSRQLGQEGLINPFKN